MKIIHTSDLHLRSLEDERWDALLRICEKVEGAEADLLLISGDLFDRKAASGRLRGEVRRVFQRLNADVVIIPGNHDAEAFEDGLDFNAYILSSPEEPLSIGEIDIWGLPYLTLDEQKTSEYIYGISERVKTDRINVLLFHGELLDCFFSGGDYGGEERTRYMPVRLSVFETCRFDYILSGHFHTSYQRFKLKKGGCFIYSGSPVSITAKEVGQRYVGMIDTMEGRAFEISVDTIYYEDCVVELNPTDPISPDRLVSERLKRYPDNARIILTVRGFINSRILGKSEEKVVREIEKIAKDKCYSQPTILLRDVGMIYENPLFVRICKKMEERMGNLEDGNAKSEILRLEKLLVEAFMEAGF